LALRGSPKTEKMHLSDAYEEWVKHQSPPQGRVKHARRPAEDLYETWIVKWVEKRLTASRRGKQAAS
jgi:hypothetical protein